MLIRPQWPVPPAIHAFFSIRSGGVSDPPYSSLNLSATVGDDDSALSENRLRVCNLLPSAPCWLRQAHSARVVHAEEISADCTVADAAYTRTANVVCAVTTADCMPILLCTADGSGVAAAHVGWRGLANNIIENTAAAVRGDGKQPLLAWIGPTIGAEHYQIGGEVRAVLCRDQEDAACFRPDGDNRWFADLSKLAARRLHDLHITPTLSGLCTYRKQKKFFSARRDGNTTGRMASLVWISGGSA